MMSDDRETIERLTGGAYQPWQTCVECSWPNSSDAMLKRRNDRFAVPLCRRHMGDTENIELTHDDIQGWYYVARDY